MKDSTCKLIIQSKISLQEKDHSHQKGKKSEQPEPPVSNELTTIRLLPV